MEPERQGSGGKTLTEKEFLTAAPLLIELNRRLQACSDLKEWGILRAQQGLYLARTHRIQEVGPIPNEIRKRFLGHEDPEVFFWVWLLEAVLAFYQSGTTRGMGFLNRANAIAGALRKAAYQEYVAAWAAHFCFTDDKYGEMAHWLRISKLDKATLPEAACRALLVAAVAWQSSGNDAEATVLFRKSRELARTIGDRATIMASITNRAAIKLNNLWIAYFLEGNTSGSLGDVER